MSDKPSFFSELKRRRDYKNISVKKVSNKGLSEESSRFADVFSAGF